jgi:formylmethanofuran--tetrahydromethanopterin N-formyltransferase
MASIAGVEIEDAFAEAFPMVGCRVIVTAVDPDWAKTAASIATGYGTSVIGCDAEAGLEKMLDETQTPDGRAGVSLLFFAFSREALEKAVVNRVGQCVMTCPTTACFNGLWGTEKTFAVGGKLRYYGDGFQISKQLDGRRFWRIPVTDGEFVCEETFGVQKGVAGGNLLILGRSQADALAAASAAVDAIRRLPDVICPFPHGVVRSGSKVGSKYKTLRASTNDPYCPTLRAQTKTALPVGVQAAYEIVIDGLTLSAVEAATRAGAIAAALPGVVQITSGNYGGSLGPYHIRLLDLLTDALD